MVRKFKKTKNKSMRGGVFFDPISLSAIRAGNTKQKKKPSPQVAHIGKDVQFLLHPQNKAKKQEPVKQELNIYIYDSLVGKEWKKLVIQMRTGKWFQKKGDSKDLTIRKCPLDPCIQVYLETVLPFPFNEFNKTFILHQTEDEDDMEIIKQFTKIDKASNILAGVVREKLEREKFEFDESLMKRLMPFHPTLVFGAKKKKHNKRKHKKKNTLERKKRKNIRKQKRKNLNPSSETTSL